jgi:hypothetical protein
VFAVGDALANGLTLWAIDCDERIRQLAEDSGWRVVGETDGKKLRTKNQAAFEGRRISQANLRLLWFHLRGSFGTTKKARKSTMRPFEHIINLGILQLDQGRHVVFECRHGSELLVCDMFKKIMHGYELTLTQHRWCNWQVRRERDRTPTSKLSCLVTDSPIADTRECRCGVPAIGHIADEDGSLTRFDDDDEVSINHAGLTAQFTVVLRSLQTMEGLDGTRPELNKQYHKEKTSKTDRRITTTRTSRPKAVQVSTQAETIDYEPDDYSVKDAQIVALPTEEREREKRRVRIAKEKKRLRFTREQEEGKRARAALRRLRRRLDADHLLPR